MSLLTDLAEFWNFNGSLVGLNGTTWTANGGSAFVTGKVEHGWYTNETAANALTCDSPWNPGAGDWGFTCWFKYDANAGLSSGEMLAVLLDTSASAIRIRAYVSKFVLGPEIRATIEIGASNSTVSLGTFNANWHHFAASYDASETTLSIWADGVKTDFTGVAAATSAATPELRTYIGGFSNTFDGTVDSLGLYHRTLSQTDVDTLYAGGDGYEISTARRRSAFKLLAPMPVVRL